MAGADVDGPEEFSTGLTVPKTKQKAVTSAHGISLRALLTH
jgi:hypothetical protein